MNKRIVYVSYPANQVSGGIKMAFKHSDALQRAGFDSVVATPDGEQSTWFDSISRVIKFNEVKQTDFLVFPENWRDVLSAFRQVGAKKFILCQNQFMAFRGVASPGCYSDFGIDGIIAVGRHVVDFCHRRFPRIPTYFVPVTVDGAVFQFQPVKKLQIAFSPRKRPQELSVICDFFRAVYPQYSQIPWVEISNLTEKEVARILGESAVYLSLCRFEATPLSILEAFSCGCLVAGFTGFGARDYVTRSNGLWAEEDQCFQCADLLARAIDIVMNHRSEHSLMVESGRATVLSYSAEPFVGRLVSFWNRILKD